MDRVGRVARRVRRYPFLGPEEHRFPNVQQVTRDRMLDYLASISWVAALDEAEHDSLLDDLRALLPDTTYRRPWETHLLVFEHASIQGGS